MTALTGNGAASAPNFAATGGIGGSGVNGGLLPSSAAAVANPIAAGNGAAAGTGGSGGLLSSDAAVDTDGGTASPPVASPLLNTIGTNGLAAGSPSGSAGVSENSGNGGVAGWARKPRPSAARRLRGGRASGDASGGGGATGTIGELREGRASFYGSVSQGGDGAGTGAAGVAAISS